MTSASSLVPEEAEPGWGHQIPRLRHPPVSPGDKKTHPESLQPQLPAPKLPVCLVLLLAQTQGSVSRGACGPELGVSFHQLQLLLGHQT